jgi:hypothetical protein
MENVNNIKKILYIGTWNHIECVNHFPNTKEFIFIDTQPRSEFDSLSFYQPFYRKNFFQGLLTECRKKQFRLTNLIETDKTYYKKILSVSQLMDYKLMDSCPFINPTLLSFANDITEQIIHYYISTNIEYNMTPRLLQDIQSADALIVSGYFPNKILLDYFDKDMPKKFIGYSQTCYKGTNDEYPDEKNTIINVLKQSKNVIKNDYFYSYYYVCSETGSYKKFATFKDFLENSKY